VVPVIATTGAPSKCCVKPVHQMDRAGAGGAKAPAQQPTDTNGGGGGQ
jgi:hypothetical protein